MAPPTKHPPIATTTGSPSPSEATTPRDELEMAALGKKQQLHRSFSFLSILGFSCIAMVTWEGLLCTFLYGLQNGGPGGLIIQYFFVWAGYALVIASLAEMMSMWPTSGGQYHWTATLSPPTWAPFLSYLVGWQSVIAWQAIVASAAYLTGTQIQGLVVLNYPDYDFKLWHGTLLIYAVMLFSLVMNTIFAKWLHLAESLSLFLHVAGFIVVIVVISVMAPVKTSVHDVFQLFLNEGNWPTQGVSWWIGLQGVVFAWLGADGAIHMAEEIRSASVVLPWSLMTSVVINGVLGFATLVAILFCSGNLDDALKTPTDYPFMEIFTYASGSVSGGTGLSAIVVVMCCFATMTELAASSRELWAFARDQALPGSHLLMQIHAPSKLPLWTIGVTMLVTLLLALINIGSALAFNAVLSLTVAGFVASYMLPLGLILYRRVQAYRGKGKDLPWGPWRMGTAGIFVNAAAFLWCILIFFWSFWPTATPTPAASMNWSVLVYGVVTLFALVFWVLDGRKRYKGPVRDAAGGQIEQIEDWTAVNKAM